MAASIRLTVLPSGQASASLVGDLDLTSVASLEDQFAWALMLSPDLVLDLREVTFLDAAVIGCLMRLRAEAMAQGGSVSLVTPSPFVRKVLRIARVSELSPVVPDPQRPGLTSETSLAETASRLPAPDWSP